MPFDGAVIVADPYPARTSSNGITPNHEHFGLRIDDCELNCSSTIRNSQFAIRNRYFVTTFTSLPGTTTTSATCLPSMNFRTFSLLIASDFASASVSPAGT